MKPFKLKTVYLVMNISNIITIGDTEDTQICKHNRGTYNKAVIVDGDLSKSYIEVRCKKCHAVIKVLGK